MFAARARACATRRQGTADRCRGSRSTRSCLTELARRRAAGSSVSVPPWWWPPPAAPSGSSTACITMTAISMMLPIAPATNRYAPHAARWSSALRRPCTRPDDAESKRAHEVAQAGSRVVPCSRLHASDAGRVVDRRIHDTRPPCAVVAARASSMNCRSCR